MKILSLLPSPMLSQPSSPSSHTCRSSSRVAIVSCVIIQLLWNTQSASAQSCADFGDSCSDCLVASKDVGLQSCAWLHGVASFDREWGCIDGGCGLLSDWSCYSDYNDGSGKGDTDAICEVAIDHQNDWDLCLSRSDCSSCVSTGLSDGESTCLWFPLQDECQPIMELWGGESTCVNGGTNSSNSAFDKVENFVDATDTASTEQDKSDDGANGSNSAFDAVESFIGDTDSSTKEDQNGGISCNVRNSCEECLRTSDSGVLSPCSWVPALFYESYPCTEMSCDIIADPNCSSIENFVGGGAKKTAKEICGGGGDGGAVASSASNGNDDIVLLLSLLFLPLVFLLKC